MEVRIPPLPSAGLSAVGVCSEMPLHKLSLQLARRVVSVDCVNLAQKLGGDCTSRHWCIVIQA